MFKLREIERKDLDIINIWRNDIDIISLLGAPFRYINLNVDIDWFDHYMENRNNCTRCAVTEDESDDIIGLVSLTNIDQLNQSAEIHIMIGNKKNQMRGVGTFAINSMLKHAFYNINLQRIELNVLENNVIAQHLYKKIGFVKEGIKRNSVYKNGQFENMLIYAILKDEFNNILHLK